MKLDDVVPTSLRSLLAPVAMGLGIAVLAYAGIRIVLMMSIDASSATAAELEETLPASQVVTRFAAAVVAGDGASMARYAAADVTDALTPDTSANESPTEVVYREIRRQIAERGLVRVDIEQMTLLSGGMSVEAAIHMLDPAHFERWAEHHPPYNASLDEVIASHAKEHSGSTAFHVDLDRAANLIIIAEAGTEAFEAVQDEIASVKTSYIDEFFVVLGSDAEYMLEPLPTTTFLLERRSGRWVIISKN